MILAFSLGEHEQKEYDKWYKKHHTKRGNCRRIAKERENDFNPHGAIGGHLTFSFVPTGIGVISLVECACGEKINLSDMAGWQDW